MFNMLDLTKEQWKKIEGQIKSLVTDYAQGFDEDIFGKGEIYTDFEGGYEQREYGSNFYTLESEIADIIKDTVLDGLNDSEIEKFEEEYKDFNPKYMVEGFHELVIDFGNWLSDELPNEWYVYYEDGDIWVARRWNDIDEIPEDLKHLVNED